MGLVHVAAVSCLVLAIAPAADAEVEQLKDLHRKTTLIAEGKPAAAIVAPSDGRYAEAVGVIQQAVQRAGGVELPVLDDDARQAEQLLRDQSLIVLGNMSTSQMMYTLYRQWYTFLDLRYPGRNGSVVRSLHDPFATGHNILLVGGSDDTGVLQAAQRFADQLEAGDPLTVGWLMDIELGDDVPTPPDPQSEEIYAWSDSTRFNPEGDRIGRNSLSFSGWNPFSVQATLYYMTGDEKYLHEFLRLAIPDPENLPQKVQRLYVERSSTGEYDLTRPIGMAHHYTAHRMPLIWDLIEESPGLTDEQRLRITNDLLTNSERVMGYGMGHSRHGSYAALTLFGIGRYFQKSYPDAQWEELLERVDQNFRWWTKHPTWGEGDDLAWINTCLHPVAHYFLLTDPEPWVESGIAKTMMDTLPAIWSGRPYEESIAEQPLNLMLAATWLLDDARYAEMAWAAKYDLERFRIGRSWWPRPEREMMQMDDVAGRMIVVPLPEPDAREAEVEWDSTLGYHFVSYRDGAEPNDGFFLIDGFDGRERNPHHVSAIIQLRSGGEELLAGFGNQLHVLREGFSENHAPLAAQLDGTFTGEGMAYVNSFVPNNAWSQTRREVLWIDDQLTLVIDSIAAERGGDFEITNQWEPVRALHPSEADRRWAQSDGERPITLVAAQTVRVSNVPGPIQHSRSLASLIDGLLTDDYGLQQKLHVTLAAGEQTSLVNAIYADDAPGQFAYRLDAISGTVTLVSGKTQAIVALGEGEVEALTIAAGTLYISDSRLFAHAGRHVQLDSDPLFRASQPVDLAWNLADGSITMEASSPVKLSLQLASDAAPAVDGTPVQVVRSGKLSTIELPAGMHQITSATPGFADALARTLGGLTASPADDVVRRIDRPETNWSAAWTAELKAPVRLIEPTPAGDELWVSSERPALHRVGLDGEVRWTFDLPAPADAIALSDEADIPGGLLAVAGGQDNELRAFDADGQLLWSAESEVWAGHQTGEGRWDARWYTNPSWTTGIRSVLIGDLAGNGKPQVLVGRPATVESWTIDGKLVERNFVRWGEASMLQLVPGDDHTRLLVGNFYTGREIVHTYGPDLKVQPDENDRWNYLLPVPEDATDMTASLQRGIAALRVVDLNADGNDEVVVARGGHWNDLRAYNRDGTKCLWMHSFGAAAPRIVQEHKGRFIREMSVGALAGRPGHTVAVALANGWAHCFAADGEIAWSREFAEPVVSVTHVAGHVAVGLRDGTVALLDNSGEVVKAAQLDGEIRVLAAVGQDRSSGQILFAGTDTGAIVALEP